MKESEFTAAHHALQDRIFPSGDRPGAIGEVLVDAEFLRWLLARFGGRELFRRAELEKAAQEAWQAAQQDGPVGGRAFQQGVYRGLQRAISILEQPKEDFPP